MPKLIDLIFSVEACKKYLDGELEKEEKYEFR